MGVYAVAVPPRTTIASPWRLEALVAALVAAGLCAIGAFWNPAGIGRTDGWDDYWPSLIYIAVVAWLAFGLAIRTANAMNSSDRALGLVLLSGITLAAYWTGVPAVLLIAGFAAMLRGRHPLTLQDGVTLLVAGAVLTGLLWTTFAG